MLDGKYDPKIIDPKAQELWERQGTHRFDPDAPGEVFSPGVSWVPGGFGLGLTLCRQIVRMHGGTLDVESRTGCTTFRAVLPQLGRSEVHISDEEDAEHAA